MSLIKVKKGHQGYFFIAPFIIGFLAFGLYPVLNTIYLSFTDTTLLSSDVNLIGLKTLNACLPTTSSQKPSPTPGSSGD